MRYSVACTCSTESTVRAALLSLGVKKGRQTKFAVPKHNTHYEKSAEHKATAESWQLQRIDVLALVEPSFNG